MTVPAPVGVSDFVHRKKLIAAGSVRRQTACFYFVFFSSGNRKAFWQGPDPLKRQNQSTGSPASFPAAGEGEAVWIKGGLNIGRKTETVWF